LSSFKIAWHSTGLPPEGLLKASQHTYKFFRRPEEGSAGEGGGRASGAVARYRMRTQADFESTNGQLAPAGVFSLHGWKGGGDLAANFLSTCFLFQE